MEINDNTYNEIIKLEDKDSIFEKTLKLFSIVSKKYETIKNEEKNDVIYRKEVEVVFSLLHFLFSSEDFIDDSDEEEVEKFRTMNLHLKNTISNINTMDLVNPKESEKESLEFILNYFKESEENIVELHDSMDQINDKLSEFGDTLERNIQIAKTNDILNKEEIDNEDKKYLSDIKIFFNKEIKDKFNKENVIKVMKNLYSENSIDYYKEAKAISENTKDYTNEEKSDISKNFAIEQLLSIVIRIKKKLNQ